ncbi:DUF1549 and DUF1553 domain-containing protein [Undibacterium sp. TJN19]|uniref:DUF1549 and DUF1553 domain-containing protein n=1 Tax=Undibacterium sp. TJN19 TaxID=3413055 RepID=UPI003BF3B121
MYKPLALAIVLALSGTAISLSAAEEGKAITEIKTKTQAAVAQGWAYQPLKNPELPVVKQKSWVHTPVDTFILAQLEAKGIKPSPDADRASFIRRATLDTWGVIPTPEEVQAFASDKSSKAYEKLVDRLLASNRYGERWGRRWLDLTRYADSDGFNADGTRPNVWRYRDYVIKAFNEDKPYDRFIQEQLAGDELFPGNQEALIATGFLRNYPDEVNARDLNLKQVEIATDLTDTVGSVFLATTVGCAACHNHKFDKISQKEYYQLQSFFVNASASDDIIAATGKQKEEYELKLAKWEAATKDIHDKQENLIRPIIDKAEADRLLGFVPATRESITKPESERTAYDRWIYHRNLWTMQGRTRNAVNQLKTKDKDGYEKYQKLEAELKKFDNIKPKHPGYISAMTELGHAEAPPTYVLANGIYDRHLEEVQPAFLSLLTSEKPNIVPTVTSSGRRSALANWLTSTTNPLPARVFVNRVWAQYFGRGIVESVSDFGKMGTKPSHPELLDYLASNFIKEGWSVKKLQRQILLSNVYRQSSAEREDTKVTDPSNKLLASFPRLRLDAEQIRDSLLLASDLLEEKLGGPSVLPPVPSNFNAGNAWLTSTDPHDYHRRSVYVFTRRNIPYPLLETFDMANPQLVHSKRDVTTTAPQALALINSDLVFQWSQALAGRVLREAGNNESAQIDRLYQILYARLPDKTEKATLLSFLDSQEKIAKKQLADGKKVGVPEGFGESPELRNNIDKLYKTAYGRSADRFEKIAFLEFLEKQKQAKPKSAQSEDDADSNSPQAAKDDAQKLNKARAAAFLSLVHAAANSNEFSYRF